MSPIQNSRSGLIRHYIVLLLLFLAYLAVCITLFLFHEKSAVGEQALRTLQHNVQQQCEYFGSVLDAQFASLEGLADFIVQQDDLMDPDNLVMADMIVSNGDFSRIMLIDPSGAGFSNDGAVTNVFYRDYFLHASSGRRFVSDPLSSSLDNRETVVLSVPITAQSGEIMGVVGGAYDIGELSKLLFSDLYEGAGHPLLATSAGQLISTTMPSPSSLYDNFFAYCSSIELLGNADQARVRQDFASGVNGYFSARNAAGEVQYMVYQPASLGNGWMMCYTISYQEAMADYAFIFRDVLCLGAAFLAGLLLLLAAFLRLTLRERRNLLRKAQTDPLTGLLNRSSTREFIVDWLTSSPDCHGVLMMLDLDNFKDINDLWGHQAGDAVLSLAARFLRTHFRQSDVVGRIGGDEFMILMKDVADRSVVERHLARLCEEFHMLTHPDHPQVTLSCSVGAALAPEQGQSFEILYANADHALYRAKRRGKDSYCVYTGEGA